MPGFLGAHTQAETLNDRRHNLSEVIPMTCGHPALSLELAAIALNSPLVIPMTCEHPALSPRAARGVVRA
ncbi:MAG: hypothetical protein ACPL89_18730, partial [Roseiflexus castenholzii]